MFDPLDPYASAEDFPALANDMARFLDNPQDIGRDLFTAQEIKRLMFNLSTSDIVEKIMSTNAINFIKRNLGKN